MKRKNQKLISTGRLSGNSGRGDGVEFVKVNIADFVNGELSDAEGAFLEPKFVSRSGWTVDGCF